MSRIDMVRLFGISETIPIATLPLDRVIDRAASFFDVWAAWTVVRLGRKILAFRDNEA